MAQKGVIWQKKIILDGALRHALRLGNVRMEMKKGKTRATGDVWRIYVPATLGYDARTDVSGIPAHSTLIFDLNLVDFYPIGTPVPDDYQ